LEGDTTVKDSIFDSEDEDEDEDEVNDLLASED
jgi:hypothetical protein